MGTPEEEINTLGGAVGVEIQSPLSLRKRAEKRGKQAKKGRKRVKNRGKGLKRAQKEG